MGSERRYYKLSCHSKMHFHHCLETNWQGENTSGKRKRGIGRDRHKCFLLEDIVRLVGVGAWDGVG